jgi:hypothetical protein
MIGVSGDHDQLEKALRDLLAAWAVTEAGWQDRARTEFAEEHLNPLDARVRLAVRTSKQLSALLEEAIRECR